MYNPEDRHSAAILLRDTIKRYNNKIAILKQENNQLKEENKLLKKKIKNMQDSFQRK